MTYRAAVALGSNLGDRLAALRRSVAELSRIGGISAVSSLYETAPVGGPEQGPYLNAVVVLETERPPLQLLDELNWIEKASGRVRTEHWGPRTLDLDLIAVTDGNGEWQRMDTERLVLPHPRAHLRRFVIDPLAEVWPSAEVDDGRTAATLLPAVADQDLYVLGGDWVNEGTSMARRLVALQMLLLIGWAAVVATTGRFPEGSWLSVALGGMAVLVGGGLALWAAASLGSALSPFPEPRAGTSLVESGPYRVVRHPIYSGLVVALIGVAVIVGSVAGGLIAIAIGVFFWFKARYEETRLRLAVPGYAAYLKRVRGRLLPVP